MHKLRRAVEGSLEMVSRELNEMAGEVGEQLVPDKESCTAETRPEELSPHRN